MDRDLVVQVGAFLAGLGLVAIEAIHILAGVRALLPLGPQARGLIHMAFDAFLPRGHVFRRLARRGSRRVQQKYRTREDAENAG